MKKHAAEYLTDNPLLHADMLSPIVRETAEILYAGTDGVLIRETKSSAYMLSVKRPETGVRLMPFCSDGRLFCLHQRFMVPKFVAEYGLAEPFECLQAVYMKDEYLPSPVNAQIHRLTDKYLPEVTSCYNQKLADADYIKARLNAGAMYGIFPGGTLAGFIGTHAEGGIGMLEVLKAYRQRGYGSALVSHMVNLKLQDGYMPFCQTKTNNKGSIGMLKKLGFAISKESVFWLQCSAD